MVYEDASRALAECGWGKIDLAVTDLIMRTQGEDLSSYLNKEQPQTPIVVMTGAVGERLENLQQLQIGRVLKIPFHPQELVEALRDLLQ